MLLFNEPNVHIVSLEYNLGQGEGTSHVTIYSRTIKNLGGVSFVPVKKATSNDKETVLMDVIIRNWETEVV